MYHNYPLEASLAEPLGSGSACVAWIIFLFTPNRFHVRFLQGYSTILSIICSIFLLQRHQFIKAKTPLPIHGPSSERHLTFLTQLWSRNMTEIKSKAVEARPVVVVLLFVLLWVSYLYPPFNLSEKFDEMEAWLKGICLYSYFWILGAWDFWYPAVNEPTSSNLKLPFPIEHASTKWQFFNAMPCQFTIGWLDIQENPRSK